MPHPYSLFGQLDEVMVGAMCEGHESVAVVVVVYNQLASTNDGSHDHHEEGGDGRGRLEGRGRGGGRGRGRVDSL